MATDGRSMSDGTYKKGSSRIDGEELSPNINKRPSGESFPDGTKRQKIVFGMKSKQSASSDQRTDNTKGIRKTGIQIKLSSNKQNNPILPVRTRPTASIFNPDEDEEPEEMPPEAKMRMRNIGRDTPTSAGPNSFGKTKQGFCDSKKVFEKSLKAAIEKAATD